MWAALAAAAQAPSTSQRAQRNASAALREKLVAALEALLLTADMRPRLAARGALQAVLCSTVSQPPGSLLEEVFLAPGALSARLAKVLVDAWGRVPEARRRLFLLLVAFARARPEEAQRALPLAVLLPLLGAQLPGDQQLACYHWRELPRHLLPSEMIAASGGGAAVLHKVLRGGGSYGSFEHYMETYVGLLRENTFSLMRAGLVALRLGRLKPKA